MGSASNTQGGEARASTTIHDGAAEDQGVNLAGDLSEEQGHASRVLRSAQDKTMLLPGLPVGLGKVSKGTIDNQASVGPSKGGASNTQLSPKKGAENVSRFFKNENLREDTKGLHDCCISKHDFVHLKQDFEELHRRFVLAQQTSEEQHFSTKMFETSSGNKTSSSYFLTGSQSGAGDWEEGIHVVESFEWGYMETEDGSMVRVKLNKQGPTHSITDKQEEKLTSKFSNMSLRSVGGSKSNSNPTSMSLPMLGFHKDNSTTIWPNIDTKMSGSNLRVPNKEPPSAWSNKYIRAGEGTNPGMKQLKKGFYTQDNTPESFEDVCSTSKWAANSHVLNGLSVSYAGEKYELSAALAVAVADGIPLVMPDAPLRSGHLDSRGDKNARVPASLTIKPWAASCNYAVLPDLIKGIAAEVIPDYRTGQNVNHQEGKVLFMTLLKLGFAKTTDSHESIGKQWLLDHNLSASDPLVWNYAVALLIARFNTEDNQARIIRNFQAGVQGNKSLATYFDTMLESAKGASSSMSFQQQANTIRSGLRDGTLVKAQLMSG